MLLFGLTALLISCSQTDKFVYRVNSYTVPCKGDEKTNCLLVQKSKTVEPGKWVNFNSTIEGFSYEPGYIYTIEVKEEALKNVPADAPSVKYILVKELSKTPDPKININDIWLVTAINGEAISRGQENKSDAVLEIHLSEMGIGGSDGCNRLIGSITKFDDGVIEFGPMAGTMMMCPDMTVANKLNAAFPLVKKFKIENNNLILSDENNKELIRCKKVD